MQNQSFVRLDQLASKPGKPGLLPISKATVWRYCRSGLLPAPIHLGPRITAWSMAEIAKVTDARHAGASDQQISVMVAKIIAARGGK